MAKVKKLWKQFTFPARWESRCAGCHRFIYPGDTMTTFLNEVTGKWAAKARFHSDCYIKMAKARARQQRAKQDTVNAQ